MSTDDTTQGYDPDADPDNLNPREPGTGSPTP